MYETEQTNNTHSIKNTKKLTCASATLAASNAAASRAIFSSTLAASNATASRAIFSFASFSSRAAFL